MPTTHTSAMRAAQRQFPEGTGRRIVGARSAGRCEVCWVRLAASWSHRHGRGQGGTWSPTNGVHTCGDGTTGCHGWLTANRTWAAAGGWQTLRDPRDPADVPVYLRTVYDRPGSGSWWLLDPEGIYVFTDPDRLVLPVDDPGLYVPDGHGGFRPAHLPYALELAA